MSMQPDQSAALGERWSWAVQRELDSFQRASDIRLTEFANRLDKVVSLVEYAADKRSSDLQLANIAAHIVEIKKDLDDEITERKRQHEEYVKARQAQIRWYISMILIPIVLGVVQLLMSSK
jgi:hypothetical protein